MATKGEYSLIRGRRMRVTSLNGCGVPNYGEEASAVTDGFISVAFTAQTTEAEPIEITNANGDICARDPGQSKFNGYQLELTFCGVLPCVFEMLTGQPPVQNINGETVGFRMNSSIDQASSAFALEVWAGVPGVACDPTNPTAQGSYGYVLVPFVSQGVIGDFTIENGAVNFVVSGASTKDGNAWGVGPYDVVEDATGAPGTLPPPGLDGDDHLYVVWTPIAPPDVTDGCVVLERPVLGGVMSGAPGSFTPSGALPPANLAALKADPVVGDAGTAKPTTAWVTGDYVVLGDASQAYWDGAAWMAGKAPVVALTGVTAGNPGSFAPANAPIPANLAALKADAVVGDAGTSKPTTAWVTGEHVVLGDASQANWNGTMWVAGQAVFAARSVKA